MRTPLPDSPPAWVMTTEPLPRTGTEVVVELRGIKKSFGSTEVLHGVDLTIHTGEHVVIFGPSGLGEVDAPPHDQPARGADRGLGPPVRRRVRAGPAGREEQARRPAPASPPRRDGLPAVQPLPPPDRAAQHLARAALREANGPARGGGAGCGRAPSGRAAPLRGPVPRASSPAGSSSVSRSPAR